MERKPGLSKGIGDKDVSISTYNYHYLSCILLIIDLTILILNSIIVHSKESSSEQKVWRCSIQNWWFDGKNAKRCQCSE